MRFTPKTQDAEEGFVLLAAIFLCVLLLISVAIAAPKMARSIQRDKELETIHRGEQYRRAIQLYYRKFQRYPTSIDQLVNTNQIRFLRKKYTDPLTGKDDWKPILFGQAHVRPLGFFGQPLMAMAGLGGTMSSMYAPTAAATDANGVPVAPGDDSSNGSAASGSAGSSGMFGSSPSTPGTGFGSSAGSSLGSGSTFGSNPSSPMGGSGMSPMGGAATSPTGGFGATSNAPGAGTSATTFGGGGPIVGFTLPVKKPSLIDYMKQTAYNHWEFNYDPMADQAQAMAGLGGGAGATNPNGTGGLPTSNGPGSTTQPPNNGSTLMSPDTPTTTGSPDGTTNSSPDGSTTNPPDSSSPQ
jgi:type II secretory pathway pseudopilin PulG